MRSTSPLAVLLLLCGLLVATIASASAATWHVDRTDDAPAATACTDETPDDCSLRGAVLNANAAAQPSTIELPAGTYPISAAASCTYRSATFPFPFTSSVTELCFTKPTTIVGAGAETTIIDGGLTNRLAYLDLDSEVEISGVTLQRGTVVGSFANGAAIWNDGTLTLRNAIVRANVAEASGGGIFSNGPLSVFASRFEANLGREGGALRVHGPSTFVDSHFTDNAGGVGGALFLYRSTIPGSAPVPVAITGCLVDGNQSGLGAISSTGANVVVTNTTISGNRGVQGATGLGAGIRVDSGTMALRNVTITDNEGVYGGGISILSGTVSLRNAILAGNRATAGGATDCLAPPESPLLSEGHNLLENPAGCSIAGDTTGNLIGQPALLGALAANGGPTLTHAPGPGSPALDAGSAAPPGSGGTACAATDQRGVLRPEGTRCDIGALEKPPALGLGGVEPSSGGNVGSVLLRAFGSGFEPGASVRLVRAGEADVVGSSAQVDFGNSTIAASLDLGGRTAGTWDVLVENPGGATATLAAGFTIEAGGGPDLWLDLSGRAFARTLRATTLVVELGNRGNVDAIGVPLTISFPSDVRVGVHGDVLVPPLQPAQVFEDWSLVPLHVSENTSTRIHVPLLVPVIPAKSTRSVRLSVVLLGSSDAAISAAMGTPYFQDGVDPAAVASRVDAALAIVERTAGLPIPGAIGATLHADATAYVTAQSEAIRADALGRGAEVLGAPPRLYSESQLQLDAAYFAAQQAGALLIAQSPEPQALGSRVRANLFATAQAFQHMLSALASGTADAAIRGQKCPAGNRAAGVLAPGTSGGGGCQSDGGLTDEIGPKGNPPPPTCFEPVARILGTFSNAERQQAIRDLKECGPGVEDCESLPDHEVLIVGGAPVCAPKDPARCKIKCGTFPIKPVVSFDPNDKVGRAGAGQARYVNDRAPATYTVYFENLETASGAAQEVVVSDTLDTTKLDTSTFTLGPIAFGDRTLTPATGVQTWSGGVDLRPQQNLIVSVEAGLDETTGVATWRFRSLDPDTLEMTDDPTAGFLPPNVTPPEGDGSVSFTIAPKASIADGDLVCNSASIVFDVNAPILTPRFCNTLDVTAPQSQVTSLPPTSPAAPFLVQWTSADNGAGIVGTTIFVSKDGGPYETLVDAAATETSFQFTPEPGRLYAFYSVAVDAAGNREAPPATADAETTTQGSGGHDLAVLAAKVPRRVALTAKKPSRSVQVKVQLQNRSGHAETIATAEALGALVTLHVHSLGPCTDVTPVLRQAPFAKKLPLTWKPKKTLTLVYDARFDCANDASKGTPDYEVTARVNHLAIGNADAHPQDDVCPRTATPGSMDPFPDGKIKERGCGVKRADRTLGGPITVDITVR